MGIGVVRRQSGQQVEAGQAERMNHAMSAAGDHRIDLSATNQFGGFANCLATGGASGQAIDVRTLDIEHGGQVRGRHARFLFQFQFRIENAQPFANEGFQVEFAVLGMRGAQHLCEVEEVLIAFTGAEVDADAAAIFDVYRANLNRRWLVWRHRQRISHGGRASSTVWDLLRNWRHPNCGSRRQSWWDTAKHRRW